MAAANGNLTESRPRGQPAFLRQGLLIVLPVVVLAAMGLVSLRQDRILAQHDATERAQAIADEMAETIWTDLTSAREESQADIKIDRAGQLVFPPPFRLLPEPHPLDQAELTEEQARLWESAQRMERENAMPAAIESYQHFRDRSPTEDFAAAACFRLGLLLADQGNMPEAAAIFQTLIEKYPRAVGESGLPLAPLAELKRVELASEATNQTSGKLSVMVESLCSNAVLNPSLVTPLILNKAAELAKKLDQRDITEQWRIEWRYHQVARRLYAAASPHLQIAPGFNTPPVKPPLLVTSGRNEDASVRSFRGQPNGQMTKPPRLFWIKASGALEGIGDGPGMGTYNVVVRHSVFGNEERYWLATRFDEDTNGFWIACRTEESGRQDEIGSRLEERATMPEPNPNPPQYHYLWRATWNSVHLSTSPPSNAPPRGFYEAADSPASSPSASQPASAPARAAPRRHPVRIPSFFSIGLDLASNVIISSNNLQTLVRGAQGKPAGFRWVPYRGPGLPPPILATAARVEDGIEYLRCNVHLASPQMLFAAQRERTFLFSLLIGASTVAALIGFFSARRAFYRQQRLVEMKSNFVSSVSHELRAPIASVRLMAEGLEHGRIQEPAKQNEYFRFIVQECRRLSSMIENVLDFSRIEDGRKQYEFEPTDLRALVAQTANLMMTQAAEKQIRLEAVVTGEPVTPEVDGRAIQQALVNLLDNALKHSPNGSIIRIGLEFPPGGKCSTTPTHLEPQPEQDGEPVTGQTHPAPLLLWVEDSGDGIPPEEHERIFERFYRCGSELRRETQGVGIGLSIVKHIVEAHGGRVLVRSAVGQGSRFTIELLPKPCHAS